MNSARRWPDHATVWRWHFYAGLVCIPFVLWLAATGSIYLFKPQIDAWMDRPYDNLAPPSAAPPSAQVAAALRAVPGSVLNAYQLPTTASSAVQVLVAHGTQLWRVYVHPQTLRILHVTEEDARFTNVIFHLHGELMQGDRGSLIVEAAASWALVMLLTGLYLWWPSAQGLGGVLYPRWRGGRLWWRDLHAVTGFWVSFFALFLLISGLPWAKSWGGLLKDVRHVGSAPALAQDWTTGRSSELEQRRLEASQQVSDGDEHAGHAGHGDARTAPASPVSELNALVPLVQQARLVSPVLISPPAAQSPHWRAHSETPNRPQRADLELDGPTGTVLTKKTFEQKPLIDRVIGVGIAAHEGQLFAPANQALGLFTAISLWIVCISAVVMWWRRRPVGVLGAPPAKSRPRLARSLVALIVMLGILLPLMGVSLLAVIVLESTVLRRLPRARDFLGLPIRA
jgi:uncharacterized iron-regulated membrane protein